MVHLLSLVHTRPCWHPGVTCGLSVGQHTAPSVPQPSHLQPLPHWLVMDDFISSAELGGPSNTIIFNVRNRGHAGQVSMSIL